MKALVLAGGLPQIALINNLKKRGITVVLADMNENVAAKKYADKFYAISVLDVDAVREVASKEKVDFVITVCADQVLQVMAEVSEDLNLPCYIDFDTAKNVSKKSYMKKIFLENGVPTSRYVIMDNFDEEKAKELKYPLIVKPVDSYSSRGVCKIISSAELETAFENAKEISRTKTVIVEEFVEGDELTVDCYIENSAAKILCVSKLSKIGEEGKFVIHRTEYPADISDVVYSKICQAAQGIADAFALKNAPMLIQLIVNGDDISVVEFCARTGGGDKFRLIEKVTEFDVIDAVVELTLGNKPHFHQLKGKQQYITNEFLYCKTGVLDNVSGFDELLENQIITEYFILKEKGYKFNEIRSSGDRVAYYTVESDAREDMQTKRVEANKKIKALDINGNDLIRHDLVEKNF